jgi:hypothetical protein
LVLKKWCSLVEVLMQSIVVSVTAVLGGHKLFFARAAQTEESAVSYDKSLHDATT